MTNDRGTKPGSFGLRLPRMSGALKSRRAFGAWVRVSEVAVR